MENLILPLVGLVVLIIGVAQLIKRNKLLKTGKVSEGIVFDLIYGNGSDRNLYPVVRFLTTKQEWITETSSAGFSPSPYKKGEKVNIIYNENNPKDFIIESWVQNLLPYIFIIAGCVGIIVGSYLFLKGS